MASIRKRNQLWQVQVRRKGVGSVSKSFHRKSDALNWAITQEAMMQAGDWKPKIPANLTIGHLIKSYLEKVTPHKKGAAPETRRLTRLLSEKSLMAILLDDARPHHFATFRDRRLKDGKRACQYDLVLLRAAWNIARIEWGWSLSDNPLSLIRFPTNNPPRERRLRAGEYETLFLSSQVSRAWYLWPIIEIALETCMRRGEILGLTWHNINLEKGTAYLPSTKNGRSRRVPLSPKARDVLLQLPRTADKVFPTSDVAFRQAWDRLRQRSGIVDLTFHDLRHEGISRLFESGMSIPQVMAVSGHSTASQLFRYIQLSDGIRSDSK